jgi:hypothetical protein
MLVSNQSINVVQEVQAGFQIWNRDLNLKLEPKLWT